MIKIATLYLSFSVAILFTFSGYSNDIEISDDLGNFNGISLECNIHIYLKQGDSNSVIIKNGKAFLKEVDAKVSDGILRINTRKSEEEPFKPFIIKITMKNINRINVSNGGKITADKIISNDKLIIRSVSASDIILKYVETEDLTITASDKGKIVIASGKINKASISITSYGLLMAKEALIEDAKISVSSYGEASVRVSNKISSTVYNDGLLYLYGNPLDESKNSTLYKIKEIFGLSDNDDGIQYMDN